MPIIVRRVNRLSIVVAFAAGLLALLLLAVSRQATHAQTSNNILVDKRLGRSSPVVYVGEYITFTIRVENRTAFTVTTLPLSDTFNTVVLAYVDATPAPDVVDETTGRIDWADLTNFFGDLAPGQQVFLVVGFIAEHPQSAVVNAAEAHDVLGSSGALSGTNSTLTDTQSVGGSAPVDKELVPGLIPQVGLPLTFSVVVTNNGYVTMTVVPLVDNYDTSRLTFSYAVPPPDVVDPVAGMLTWTDLTNWSGDIPPFGTVRVTTVFTALAEVQGVVNGARVVGARDWYDNDLGGGSDEVPITIIGGLPPRPTRVPPTQSPATPAPASTPVVAVTPTPTLIFLLPQSGGAPNTVGADFIVFIAILIGLVLGVLRAFMVSR